MRRRELARKKPENATGCLIFPVIVHDLREPGSLLQADLFQGCYGYGTTLTQSFKQTSAP